MRQQLPEGIRFNWVESHQDNSKRKEVRMNEEADEHADKQYEEKGDNRSKSEMQFLPHQTVQIFFHGDQYDRDYKIQASRHYHGPWAEKYIQEKMSLSNTAMRIIDWEGIKSQMNS